MRNLRKTSIPWLPELYEEYGVCFVKHLFDISKDLSKDGEPEKVLKLARAGIVEKDVTTNEGQMAASYSGYNKIQVGDLVLNPMDLYSGANCNVSELVGVISPAYSNLRKKENVKIVPKYYDYYFKCQYWVMGMFAHGKGVSFDNRWTLNNDALRSYEVPLVPYEEQEQIVKKIQEEEKKVDTLISCVEEQISQLKSYRQSLITETITKGINKSKDTKDSGIEWIGDISVDYRAVPINAIFQIKKDIIGKEPDCVLSITQQGLKVKDISKNEGQMAANYDKYQIVHVGDFAMNHMDLLTGGVGISEYDGVTSPDYRVFTLKNTKMNARYFLYVMQMYYKNKIFYAFGQGAANMGRWRLPTQNFKSLYIPVAPIDEQNDIVAYLDQKCSQVDELLQIKQDKIETLMSYKQSLIYEYVIGKKEAI